jgi:hypothetical protein
MPSYKPPNPLWGTQTYDGNSYNKILCCVVSEEFIKLFKKTTTTATNSSGDSTNGKTKNNTGAASNSNNSSATSTSEQDSKGMKHGDPAHDLWLKVCQGEEEKIQERMKLICSLRNTKEFAQTGKYTAFIHQHTTLLFFGTFGFSDTFFFFRVNFLFFFDYFIKISKQHGIVD